MKSKIKHALCIFFSMIIMFCFSGCTGFFSSPVSLMAPPKSSGDLIEIEEALAEISSDYKLSYPSSGDYQNAIIIRDLDADGKKDAIVFYQTAENKTITVHMNVLALKSDKWVSKHDVTLSGTGIDRVEFTDVCGDEKNEILIGSNMYNSNEKELSVYRYSENSLDLLSQERYTDYCVCDLGASQKPQIVFFKISNQSTANSQEMNKSAVKKNVNAKLVSFSYENSSSTVALGSVNFDSNIISFGNISVSPIGENKNGIFVDAYISADKMITEIFYYDETIKTSFYNKRTNSTEQTYRESLIECRDINADGKVEIPKTYLCQGYENAENPEDKVYFTEWYGVSGRAINDRVSCGFVNTADNYFVKTSPSWLGKITVQKNLDIRERVFYEWDFTKQAFGEEIFRVRVFLKSDFQRNSRGYTKIKSDNEYVYAVKINESLKSENKVTINELKRNIILL